MADQPAEPWTPLPPSSLFPRISPSEYARGLGPQIDRSPEAREARAKLVREAIARMRAIPDDPEEDDRAFLRELDEANPGRFDLKKYYDDGPDPA